MARQCTGCGKPFPLDVVECPECGSPTALARNDEGLNISTESYYSALVFVFILLALVLFALMSDEVICGGEFRPTAQDDPGTQMNHYWHSGWECVDGEWVAKGQYVGPDDF